MRFALILAALPALALAQTPIPEYRANISVTINDPGNLFGVATSIQNSSTTPRAIRSVNFTLVPQATVIDTFGTYSQPTSENPSVGANNSGGSANSVTLTPVSPLLPGQTLTASNGDYDPSTLTGINVTVTFDDDVTLTGSLNQSPANTWGVQLSQIAAALYPISLTWEPPTENEDGTPYTNPGGYKVYWGTAAGTYANSVTINNPNARAAEVQVPTGDYYFVATAFNILGVESDHSNVATGHAGPDPNAPSDLSISVDPESDLAWLIFTIRNQIIFAEAGRVKEGASCDPNQSVRAPLPNGEVRTLNLVAATDVNLLPSVPAGGEIALFAECSAN